ncbi:ATP-dependent Clp protease adapter ClpS [Devriesea agamarum]|uniref:ATP-dependent Clp protease adapter ClpS n=1 Tax=Devriesea agamarum TaxID=472569 RepID=UPI000A7DC49C
MTSSPESRGCTAPGATSLQEREWVTVVWNDPINLMSYVVYVFRRHFGYPLAKAERLMREVHEKGRAVVARGSREQAEADVFAMHSYGLHATLELAGQD